MKANELLHTLVLHNAVIKTKFTKITLSQCHKHILAKGTNATLK